MAEELFTNCSTGRAPYSLPCKVDLLLLRYNLEWLRQIKVDWERLDTEDVLLGGLAVLFALLLLTKS